MTLSEWIKNYCEENELELPSGVPSEKVALDFIIANKAGGVQPEGSINITENGENIDIAQYAYANVNVPQPSGKINITENGTNIDVAQYATADVSVESTDSLVLLKEVSLGHLTTSSTSATDTGIDVTLASSTHWADYDLFVVDVSTDTDITEGLLSTASFILATGSTVITTKSTINLGYHSWTCIKKVNGQIYSRDNTSYVGIYPRYATASGSDLKFDVYYAYNSSTTGTIDSTYTLRVYGIKLVDLIGG